jgi:hypothetical protein
MTNGAGRSRERGRTRIGDGAGILAVDGQGAGSHQDRGRCRNFGILAVDGSHQDRGRCRNFGG